MYLWKYLKSIADISVIACDESMSVMDIVSTKMTNNIATNATKNCHSKMNLKNNEFKKFVWKIIGVNILIT